jgi:hypothetical protein
LNKISRQQYQQLSKLCDQILVDSQATKVTIAISWLHVIRWHPVHMSKYFRLFEYSIAKNIVWRTFQLLRSNAVSLLNIARAIFKRDLPHGMDNLPSSDIDILFISHLLNSSFIGEDDDFYFGSIASELRPKKAIVALINHTKERDSVILSNWGGCITPRVVFRKLLSFQQEFDIFLAQRKERRRLKRYQLSHNSTLYSNIIKEAANHALSPETAGTLRFTKQVELLLIKVQPRYIITTFEGYGWERLVFATAKEINPGIVCIGYQHSAIFQLQHSIFRNLLPSFNPDIILTSGGVAKNQLEVAIHDKSIKIRVLGSKKKINLIKTSHDLKKTKICLVTPEAFKTECNILFEFSLMCALARPDIKFIWRLHPLMSFDDLIKDNLRFENIPDNVSMSNTTFEADLLKSDYILYRGSTAVVSAISLGLIPIYLQKDNDLNIDPIYDCNCNRSTAATVSDFEAAVELNHSNKTLKLLIKYGSEFYMPFNKDQLNECLKTT